ncbi:hypothetical protein PV387_29315 [Streptomyces sp. ME02-6987-2C]|uniref:hypothetical protein n=1 Tax=unclassified Streptomyces TaxID=2593676 RepID=UPI0029B9F6F3|nr:MULTISPECIES: hypothetical protein [unclassified Streptomyces]MDX3370077.1 hypothetical protein [Streptomyces sp. ME02-6987-2C]MDX3426927.1 hypothetical protein [Streptomyces sp. ME02-6985-2c]
MPTGVAVVCDTDDCVAVYLAVETGDDEDARSASEVSQLARDAAQGDGWVVSFGFRQPVMTCPGCADGRGPVRERGDCQRCMGRVDSESRCVYCLRQVEPLQPEA